MAAPEPVTPSSIPATGPPPGKASSAGKKPKKKSKAHQPIISDLEVPDSLQKKVTERMLQSGKYKRALLAHFAPDIMTETLQAIRRGVSEGDRDSIKLAAEIFEFTNRGKGISISLQQNNQQNALPAGRDRELGSFESITRTLALEREQRKQLGPAAPVYVPTPIEED